ncbi:hypothetical protein EDD16DRAFT_1527922 [Pisolithus croceorrhizus]|nr:hypothetical protein EDD16DRAFT_1527922 [Pisolithus croceorrhizus]
MGSIRALMVGLHPLLPLPSRSKWLSPLKMTWMMMRIYPRFKTSSIYVWDDEQAGHGQEDEEDMDDFIDYEDEEEAGGLDEQEWEERWCKRNCRGRIGGSWVLYPSYLESMLGDNEVELDEEAQKPEMKYQDSSTLSLHQNLTESDIDDAAAQRSVISKLVKGFGIWPCKVIQNFISLDRPNIVEDQELNPTTFTEQFVDPSDPIIPQTSTELLHCAQMILATELGKDPLLRQMIHELFNIEAQISV